MFVLKLFVKILLLPVFIAVGFIRTWVDVLSKIGCVILGLFYLVMLAIIVLYACKHMWGCVAISVGMSFAGFLISFATVAVGTMLEGIEAKLGDIIAS